MVLQSKIVGNAQLGPFTPQAMFFLGQGNVVAHTKGHGPVWIQTVIHTKRIIGTTRVTFFRYNVSDFGMGAAPGILIEADQRPLFGDRVANFKPHEWAARTKRFF